MQSNWKRVSGVWVTDYDDTNYSNVFNTTLNGAINSAVLSIPTNSTDLNGDGFPYTVNGGGQIVIDENGGNEEYINYSSHNGISFTVPVGGRGQNSTSAVSHIDGESIKLRNKRLTIAGAGELKWNSEVSFRDIRIEYDVRNVSGDAKKIYLRARYLNSSNYYEMYIQFSGSNSNQNIYDIKITKRVSGVSTILKSSFLNRLISRQFTAFFQLKGSAIEAGIVGVESHITSDADLTTGGITISADVGSSFYINRLSIGTSYD